jgi:hypothetical protein
VTKELKCFFFLIGIKNIIIIIKNVVLLEKIHSNIYIYIYIYIYQVNKNNNTTKTTCNLGIFYYLFISLW